MINCNFIAASKMAGWAFFFLPSKGGSIYNESLTSLSILTFLKLIFFIFVRKEGIENLALTGLIEGKIEESSYLSDMLWLVEWRAGAFNNERQTFKCHELIGSCGEP